MAANNQEQLSFETLVIDNDYEISVNHYPYIIRRISNHRIVKESTMTNGYRRVYLNCKAYTVHRIVASQWLENDDQEQKTEIDHINHDRSDNRLENLRWVSHSTNQSNRTAYNGVKVDYVDELSEDAFEITTYGDHEFEDLWYDLESDKFYFNTGVAFREITIGMLNGSAIIQARDVDNKQRKISINKFKRLYNIN